MIFLERNRFIPLLALATLLASAPGRAETKFDFEAADVDFASASTPIPSASPKPKTLKQLKAEIPKPGAREVKPEDFSKYQIVVDIFRASTKLPVLGKYRKAYVDALTSGSKERSAQKRAQTAQSRFSKLASAEFAVVSVDGVPVKANLVSGAIEAVLNDPVKDKNDIPLVDPATGENVTVQALKTTPPGNYMLTTRNPDEAPDSTPFPFRSSSKFERSTMFWSLWIYEGFYIHQTPHYDHLGRPASMGCIRQSNPDARWLWDLVTNQSGGRLAMIRIHEMHSKEAYSRLREIFYDPNFVPYPDVPAQPVAANAYGIDWLLGQLNENYQNLKIWMNRTGRREYEGVGHGWYNPTTRKFDKPVLPLCGGQDCVQVWGDPLKKIAKLKEGDLKKRLKQRQSLISRGLPIPRADSLLLNLIPKDLPSPAETQH